MANNNQTPLAGPAVDPPIATNPSSVRIAPTPENPRGYPPFDIHRVPAYTNNQLRYYHILGAMLDADEAELERQLDKRKLSLGRINWDGDTRENTPFGPDPPSSTSRTLSLDVDSEPDSVYPEPTPGHLGIKIRASELTTLHYDDGIAELNNWLADLKLAFAGDPARYRTGSQRIIIAVMTLDSKLKSTYNNTVRAHPALSTHWRKFRRWAEEAVLHGNSDQRKLSMEFTRARQYVGEDPNQFYQRLFNLGIQSNRTVEIEDYLTRLVKPLQDLLNRHERTYSTIQDVVAHAGRLWQTLDPDRVRQEIKEDREKRSRQPQSGHQRQSGRQQQPSGQSDKDKDQRGQQSAEGSSRGRRGRKEDHQDLKLSSDERRYRIEKNLCFNCGYPGHSRRDCSYQFNPNRVTPRNDNQTQGQTQPPRGQKRPFVKTQPVRASDESGDDVCTIDGSDADDDGPKPRKRSKN